MVSSYISLINLCIQTASFDAYLRAIYLASVVDMETVLYFLLHQDTMAPFKKKQYPITDFRSLGSPAKLLSANPTRPYSDGSLGKRLLDS